MNIEICIICKGDTWQHAYTHIKYCINLKSKKNKSYNYKSVVYNFEGILLQQITAKGVYFKALPWFQSTNPLAREAVKLPQQLVQTLVDCRCCETSNLNGDIVTPPPKSMFRSGHRCAPLARAIFQHCSSRSLQAAAHCSSSRGIQSP